VVAKSSISNEIRFWRSIFGGVGVAAPTISLLVKLFNIELSEILAIVVGQYRYLIDVLVDNVLFWTLWRPSSIVVDMLILHIILATIQLRAKYSFYRIFQKGFEGLPFDEDEELRREIKKIVRKGTHISTWLIILVPYFSIIYYGITALKQMKKDYSDYVEKITFPASKGGGTYEVRWGQLEDRQHMIFVISAVYSAIGLMVSVFLFLIANHYTL